MARLRDLGVGIGTGTPGPHNAITDVAGVRVGHVTLVEGDGPLRVGAGPVRTGVTVVLAFDGSPWSAGLFAGCDRLNGNGEVTGLEWLRESGLLTSPVALTNTHSVGVVRDALVAAERADRDAPAWSLPVVGETWDGVLNDVDGFHVRAEHVHAALAAARGGPVAEGGVGGGTGMVCHGFKGGIGTSSRVVAEPVGGWTVGVLVQANHGRRERLVVNGVPVGAAIPAEEVPVPRPPEFGDVPAGPGEAAGSIIVLVATDAPLLPTQLRRLARRASFGIARTGGVGETSSGDFAVAFSTSNRTDPPLPRAQPPLTASVQVLADAYLDPLFDAVVEATEEAIVNALVAAETMVGRDGIVAYGLDPARLAALLG